MQWNRYRTTGGLPTHNVWRLGQDDCIDSCKSAVTEAGIPLEDHKSSVAATAVNRNNLTLDTGTNEPQAICVMGISRSPSSTEAQIGRPR
jgi:hypothetical protein